MALTARAPIRIDYHDPEQDRDRVLLCPASRDEWYALAGEVAEASRLDSPEALAAYFGVPVTALPASTVQWVEECVGAARRFEAEARHQALEATKPPPKAPETSHRGRRR